MEQEHMSTHTSKSVRFCLPQSAFPARTVALLSAFSVTSSFASALISYWFCLTEKNSELSQWNCFLPPAPLLSKEPSEWRRHLSRSTCVPSVCGLGWGGSSITTYHTGLT